MDIDLAHLPDDVEALKRLVRELVNEALATQAENAKLKFRLARLTRSQFGRSSEKLAAATTAGRVEAGRRIPPKMGRCDLRQAVGQVRARRRVPLHARPLAGADPLLR